MKVAILDDYQQIATQSADWSSIPGVSRRRSSPNRSRVRRSACSAWGASARTPRVTGLDVFWTEPLPPDHAVRRLDNVVLTPHLGYVVGENMKVFYENAVKNIRNWLNGGALTPMSTRTA